MTQRNNDWIKLDLKLGNPVHLEFDVSALPQAEVVTVKPLEVPVIRRDNEGREVKYSNITEAAKATGIPAMLIEKQLEDYVAYSKYRWLKKRG